MVVKFRTPGGSEPNTDGLLKWMRRYNIPITRDYMGPYRVKPPVGLTLEEEAQRSRRCDGSRRHLDARAGDRCAAASVQPTRSRLQVTAAENLVSRCYLMATILDRTGHFQATRDLPSQEG
jgi:hypothetical protein